MSKRDNIHPFPATKLGAFLRAMEDPEGKGRINPAREREIAKIEHQLSRGETADDADD